MKCEARESFRMTRTRSILPCRGMKCHAADRVFQPSEIHSRLQISYSSIIFIGRNRETLSGTGVIPSSSATRETILRQMKARYGPWNLPRPGAVYSGAVRITGRARFPMIMYFDADGFGNNVIRSTNPRFFLQGCKPQATKPVPADTILAKPLDVLGFSFTAFEKPAFRYQKELYYVCFDIIKYLLNSLDLQYIGSYSFFFRCMDTRPTYSMLCINSYVHFDITKIHGRPNIKLDCRLYLIHPMRVTSPNVQ